MRHFPRNLRLACDHKCLTHFGGIYLLLEFLRVLQSRNFLARQLTYPRRNRRYSLSQMVLALVYPWCWGWIAWRPHHSYVPTEPSNT